MADIQKQIEDRVGQLDTGNKLRDMTAAQAIVRAKELGITSITMANYADLGYRERIGKPDAEKIAQLNSIFQRIKGEWSQILDASKRDTGKVKSLFETRKKLSDQEVENSALSKLDKANEFKYINTELNKAFTKDLEGHFIEGGILGMLNNPNTALRKAIKNIEKKYGSDLASEVQRALINISGAMETAQVILNQNTSGARKVGEGLASVVGYRNGSKLQKYWETNPNFRQYMARNLRNQLIGGGISILLGVTTGTFYGGMMKTPFKIQTVPTPTKDLVAMALYGGNANARDIMKGSIDEIDSYISRGMKNGVRAAGAEQMQRGIAQGIGIDAARAEQDINQANRTIGEFIDKIPLLGLLTDNERRLRKDMQEYAQIMENTNPSAGERARAVVLNARISNKLNATRAKFQKRGSNNNRDVALQTVSDVIAGTRQVVAVEALREGNKLKAFLNSHRDYSNIEGKLPTNPIVRQAFQAYYDHQSFAGRNGDNLLQYIWEDPSIPGVQRMVQAYTKGDYTERAAYMRDYCSTGIEGKTISTVGSKWAGNIEKIIQDPLAVQDYVGSHKNKANGLALAYGYASKVDQLTNGKLIIAPGAILSAIGNGRYNPNFSGQNTGISTSALTEKYNYTNKPALECHVDATMDGKHGTLTIGVKPDCANLVIGEFRPEGYNEKNPAANIKLRVPLLYTVKKAEQVTTTKKTKTVEKSTPEKPVAPTRNALPTRPTKTPPIKTPPVKPTQYTQPGADGPQIPTTGPLEQGAVNPVTNAQIGATPASQEIVAPSVLPGGTNLGTGGPLQ